MLLKDGDRFLFIGDSITDVGRRSDEEGLGHGYVRMFRDLLIAARPDVDVEIINRGIGGNTIRNLNERWQVDVIDEKPDVLSVCIGVNDVWRQTENRLDEAVYIEEYEETYRKILDDAVEKCGCRLALCEPSMIGETRDTEPNKIMVSYVECVRRLAEDYKAVLIPFNAAFWSAIDANPKRAWSGDGVHPHPHGHMLMAWTIFSAIGGMDGVS